MLVHLSILPSTVSSLLPPLEFLDVDALVPFEALGFPPSFLLASLFFLESEGILVE